MALRRRRSKHLELDVSAFADIAFLLIIFFILTTTFSRPAGSKVEIPAGANDPAKNQTTNLTISLVGEVIHYGPRGREMSIEELRETLLREDFASKPEQQRVVIVNSSPDVPYDLYFKVVMAIDQADGVLALLEEEEEETP
jgi:biopolymer transport protein ExbD